tara:strand:- start:236 stop:418 length:183 start_codon:yes stop_codon:yes gene_type:complete
VKSASSLLVRTIDGPESFKDFPVTFDVGESIPRSHFHPYHYLTHPLGEWWNKNVGCWLTL